ncbi:hypothetical protein C2E20_6640 [Micractinium conductrix]|uniref:Uncharacterized protein n=1 Tax=Micractinium conductrix TaxID=554055 RepID=A0A2P6V7A1_9CHLO|nr:hypothetical protein C2E20_6640 [Micractinium conductrix]|eukprot:PSC69963.1 hypothetical protein C2E20_6640 [Micractinium conductrix]
MSITGLACELASAAERGGDSKQAASLLQALCDQLAASGDDGAAELDEVLLDLQRPLLQSAALSIEAEAAARCLLTVAATVCTAREVFTLCIAALSETLSQHPPAVPTPTHGPASPAFQLFLLATLCRCLPRIRRRPLHFLADALDMQLRWAAEALPSLLLGSGSSAEQPAGISCSSSGSSSSSIACNAPPSGAQPTAAHALAVLARLATHTTAWVHSAEGQLAEQERAVALRLQGLALLQLASIALQLPENLEAAAAALPQAQQRAPPRPPAQRPAGSLLRSCAHDALHAVLAALDPHARLAQLRRMMQLPSTASAVVALQRLRQEMATAWDGNSGDSSGGIGGGGSCSLWLSEAAVGLALPCLARGTPDGWHDEGSVAAAADVQAAALSLLRPKKALSVGKLSDLSGADLGAAKTVAVATDPMNAPMAQLPPSGGSGEMRREPEGKPS